MKSLLKTGLVSAVVLSSFAFMPVVSADTGSTRGDFDGGHGYFRGDNDGRYSVTLSDRRFDDGHRFYGRTYPYRYYGSYPYHYYGRYNSFPGYYYGMYRGWDRDRDHDWSRDRNWDRD